MRHLALRLWRHGLTLPVAAGVVGILMSASLWKQSRELQALTSSMPVSSKAPAELKRSVLDLAQIGELFGITLQSPQQPPRKTTLPLTLQGSFVSAHTKHSAAVIQIAGKAPKRVMTGQEVSPGVHIEAVYKDHVVLSRSGVSERLLFPRAMALSAVAEARRPDYPTFNATQLRMLSTPHPQTDRASELKFQPFIQGRK